MCEADSQAKIPTPLTRFIVNWTPGVLSLEYYHQLFDTRLSFWMNNPCHLQILQITRSCRFMSLALVAFKGQTCSLAEAAVVLILSETFGSWQAAPGAFAASPRRRMSVDTAAAFQDIRIPSMGEGYSPGASSHCTLQLIRNGEGSYLLDLWSTSTSSSSSPSIISLCPPNRSAFCIVLGFVTLVQTKVKENQTIINHYTVWVSSLFFMFFGSWFVHYNIALLLEVKIVEVYCTLVFTTRCCWVSYRMTNTCGTNVNPGASTPSSSSFFGVPNYKEHHCLDSRKFVP